VVIELVTAESAARSTVEHMPVVADKVGPTGKNCGGWRRLRVSAVDPRGQFK
jgi:hypothetical protein